MKWITAAFLFIVLNLGTAAVLFGSNSGVGAQVDQVGGRYISSNVEDIGAWVYKQDTNISKVAKPRKTVTFDRRVSLVASGKFNAVQGDLDRKKARNYALYRIDNSWGGADRLRVMSSNGTISGERGETILSFFAWRRASNRSFSAEEREMLAKAGFSGPGNDLLITDRQGLKDAAKLIAYSQALETVYSEEEQRRLRDIVSQTRNLRNTVSTVEGGTSRLLQLVERMKNTEVPGSSYLSLSTSVWEAATLAVPSLDTFATSVEALDSELEEWRKTSSEVVESGEIVLRELQQYRREGSMDNSKAGEAMRELDTSLENYRKKTRELEKKLEKVNSGLETVKSETSSVPVLGSELDSVLETVLTATEDSLKAIDSVQREIENQKEFLERFRSTRERIYREKLAEFDRNLEVYDRWQEEMISDSEAQENVNKILIMAAVIVLTSVAMIYRTVMSIGYVLRRIKSYLYPEPKDEKPTA